MLKIKQKLCLLILLFAFLSISLSASEMSEIWSSLYDRAITLEQKYEVMLSITEMDDRDMGPVFVESLTELNVIKEVKTVSEKIFLNNLKKIIVKEIGYLKIVEAVDQLWVVYSEVEDPVVKGEAIIALGRIRANDYADDISIALRNINLFTETKSTEARDKEIIAYACVMALENLRQDLGYRPVFFASLGWYSNRSGVRDIAKNALKTMIDDPTGQLKDIVLSDSSYVEKIAALDAAKDSKASKEKKIELSVDTLELVLKQQANTIKDNISLSALRVTAVGILIDNGSTEIKSVPFLKKIIDINYDINEVLFAVQALGLNASEEAAVVLNDYLKNQNDRQSAGLIAKNNRVIIATINSLGKTGNKIAYAELSRVRFAGYSYTVVKQAEEALKNLK